MAAATISVRLLGEFAVERDGDRIPETAWSRRRGSDLVPVRLGAEHIALADSVVNF